MQRYTNIFLIFTGVLLLLVVIFSISTALFGVKSNVVQTPVVKQQPGIVVSSLKNNDIITSPLTIEGQVTGNGWSGFEGQVGSVRLLDHNNKELAKVPLAATTDWTQLPTSFSATLTFTPPADTNSGFLMFHNENASGDPTKDKVYVLAVKFK